MTFKQGVLRPMKWRLLIAVLLSLATAAGIASIVRDASSARDISYTEYNVPTTAADYIQDGLFFHFDGIENCGYGEHSDVSVNDLVSGKEIPLSSFVGIDADCLSAVNENARWWNGYNLSNGWGLGRYFFKSQTVEVVFKTEDLGTGIQFVLLDFESRRCIGVAGDNIGIGLRQATKPTWYMRGDLTAVSVTYTGSQNTCTTAFVNGILSTSRNSTNFAQPQSQSMNLGYGYNSGGFSGKVYAVRLYDRELSSSEIRYNYLIDRLRFNLP